MARNIEPPYFPTMADVIITIRDTNDNPPAFSMPEGFILTVPEGAAILRPVGTVVATDEDGGLNGTVSIPENGRRTHTSVALMVMAIPHSRQP